MSFSFMRFKRAFSVLVFCCIMFRAYSTVAQHNILLFGAVPDGKTVNTAAIQAAIDKGAKDGGKVLIPEGSFVTGTLFLRNNTTLFLSPGARLLGSVNLSDYPRVKTDFRFWGDTWVSQALIVAHNIRNITIEGTGTIDGQGGHFKLTTNKKPDRYRNRPYLLWVAGCSNVLVRDIELRSSAMWMQSYIRCEQLRIDGIRVFNHSNKNNDLMDIDGCKDVVITRVIGDSDDDGITFKGTSDRVSENIVVSDCIISSHCNALKFGTETTAGFRNVTVTNLVIRKSAVKTALTGRPEGICGIALEMVDGGLMENISISNVVIDGAYVPLFVRLGNRARKHYAEAPEPVPGRMRNIQLSNITAEASGFIGCALTGLPDQKIEGLSISNSRFVFPGGGLEEHVRKVVDELPDLYPESTMFGPLPAFGLYARHIHDLNLQGISFQVKSGDSRPAVFCDDVNGGIISGISSDRGQGNIRIQNNSNITLK